MIHEAITRQRKRTKRKDDPLCAIEEVGNFHQTRDHRTDCRSLQPDETIRIIIIDIEASRSKGSVLDGVKRSCQDRGHESTAKNLYDF